MNMRNKGFTKIDNELLELILKTSLSFREVKILLVINRFTKGFHRDVALLSIRFIAKACNIKYQNVATTLNKLQEKNIIKIINHNGKKNIRSIMINNNYDEWLVDMAIISSNQNDDNNVIKEMTNNVIKEITNKDISKEKIKKESDKYFNSLIPNKLKMKDGFIETWNEWIDYLLVRGRYPNEISVRKKLEMLMNQDDPIEIINASIRNQWLGLYSKKTNNTIDNNYKVLEIKV